MKYIKDYYDKNDYKDYLNYFFNLFINENFFIMSDSIYSDIQNFGNNILNDLINKNIKSDKKLFNTIQNGLLNICLNNFELNKQIKERNYLLKFKSNNYFDFKGYLNHDFFRLEF